MNLHLLNVCFLTVYYHDKNNNIYHNIFIYYYIWYFCFCFCFCFCFKKTVPPLVYDLWSGIGAIKGISEKFKTIAKGFLWVGWSFTYQGYSSFLILAFASRRWPRGLQIIIKTQGNREKFSFYTNKGKSEKVEFAKVSISNK